VKLGPVVIGTARSVGPAAGQERGDERSVRGDGGASAGTSGDGFGLSGVERQALLIGWTSGMAIASLIIFFDIITQTLGPAHRGFWRPVVEEMSSWLTTAVGLLLPALVAVWSRRRPRRWWSVGLAHAAGAAVYFVVHVGGFLLLRRFVFTSLLHMSHGAPLSPGMLFYEATKDVPTYAFAASAFWVLLRWLGSRAQAANQADGPALFDIRDGARLLRVPVSDILAVRSAGNYVEFLLGDGRSPLMRAALSGLEPQLAELGFVRTHRSWLVNRARMSGLRPDGSGDYTVELGQLEAPLSRRYPEALTVLKG